MNAKEGRTDRQLKQYRYIRLHFLKGLQSASTHIKFQNHINDLENKLISIKVKTYR